MPRLRSKAEAGRCEIGAAQTTSRRILLEFGPAVRIGPWSGAAPVNGASPFDDEGHDADYYVRKAEEYRAKARQAADPKVTQALEAAAREFMRKARELQPDLPKKGDVR